MQRGGGTDGQGSEGWRLRHILHPVRVFRVGKPLGPAPRGCRRPGWLWADTLGVFPSGVPGCQARGRGVEGLASSLPPMPCSTKCTPCPQGTFTCPKAQEFREGTPYHSGGRGRGGGVSL